MPTRAELQQAITRTAAERAATEYFVMMLRQRLAGWRKQECERGQIAQALLYGQNEKWTARVESLAATIDAHVTTLRGQETGLLQELAALPADAPAARVDAANPKRARPRK
jgi:hypothetical protein